MRAAVLTVLSSLTVSAVAQRAAVRISEITTPVRISLESAQPKTGGFTSIVIRANSHAVTFHPRNAVACAPVANAERKRDISWTGIEGMTLDKSLCFYVGQFGQGSSKHTVLAFISQGYASDAAPVFAVGFKENGTPYRLLERDELDLTSFTSRLDGSALLIGKPTLSQVMSKLGYDPRKDPYAATYDPFAVYIITPEEPAAYSLPESRTYNLAHHVWAGPKSSENYVVLYNIPGHSKPFVATVQNADAILRRVEQGQK